MIISDLDHLEVISRSESFRIKGGIFEHYPEDDCDTTNLIQIPVRPAVRVDSRTPDTPKRDKTVP